MKGILITRGKLSGYDKEKEQRIDGEDVPYELAASEWHYRLFVAFMEGLRRLGVVSRVMVPELCIIVQEKRQVPGKVWGIPECQGQLRLFCGVSLWQRAALVG